MIVLWVALGAAVGAPTRYLTDRALQQRTRTMLPVGTLVVNLVASFALGIVAGASDVSPSVVALVGTGFCGALSTWSTFAYEVTALASARERAQAVGYLALTVVAGLGLGALGYALG